MESLRPIPQTSCIQLSKSQTKAGHNTLARDERSTAGHSAQRALARRRRIGAAGRAPAAGLRCNCWPGAPQPRTPF
eukprot:667264-Pleurochrysis_carterae.AAC.1